MTITWFEIPALDMSRAALFYSRVLGRAVNIGDVGGHDAGLLTDSDGSLIGGIRCSPEFMKPSSQGVNIYLKVDDLEAALRATEENGGSVVMPLMDAGEFGKFAWIIDSEGNRIALNQLNPPQ